MRTRTAILLFTVLCLPAGMRALGADKTSANMVAAYKGEMTASANYSAFAEQAKKEGYLQIAILFNTASRSEAIHAANHKTVLEKMGVAVPAVTPVLSVKSTKENLAAAIGGETNEAQDLYPVYIATAKQENQTTAVKSMRWAMEVEKRHTIFFQNALAALNGNYMNTLPKFYWVCPKCGNTYDVPIPEGMCSFCGTANNRFLKITK